MTAVATLLMLVLHNAALPVLAIGAAAVLIRGLRSRLSVHIFAALFGLVVTLSTLARRWDGTSGGTLRSPLRSVYVWYQAARRVGAKPSLLESSLLGLALVPLTLTAALAALALASSGG